MNTLKLRSSISFENAITDYYAYKSKSKKDILHADRVLDVVFDILNKIQVDKKHLSQLVQYRNSKNLQRFTVEKHTIFFRIDLKKNELQVMYFVASTRIKKPFS